jgi:hypothetical protein
VGYLPGIWKLASFRGEKAKGSPIDFTDDREGCLFTVTVHRKTGELPETSGKTSGKILAALEMNGELTIPELADLIGVTGRCIERNIRKKMEQGLQKRANTNGDSDSIACIVGGVSGAYLVIKAIPKEWVRKIEKMNILMNWQNVYRKKSKCLKCITAEKV